jgi:hypothetical protein
MNQILTLSLLAISLSITTYAQQGINQQGQQNEEQTLNERVVVPIEAGELPVAITRNLELKQYHPWQIEEAYELAEPEGDASYIVVVREEGNLYAFYYTIEGNLIRQEQILMPEYFWEDESIN